MRFGVQVQNSGPTAAAMLERARVAELAGFDTLWFSDHVVNPLEVRSRSPYRADGRGAWAPERAWFDALVSMSACAAVTGRVELAAGVLVLPLREPLVLANQLASIDVLSGGRVTLGIGAGWLAEEFAALGVDFSSRGARLEEYLDVMRSLWSGATGPYAGRFAPLDRPVRLEPRPAHRIDILVGGTSSAALRRAGALGDGWYGLFPTQPSASELGALIGHMRRSAREHGRDPSALRVVLSAGRLAYDAAGRELLAAYREIGVSDLVVRADLSDSKRAAEDLAHVRDALG